ncbi:hypothetical protein [Ramlibacter humi]|uniref:STAS/SEC14 domain-containing protein n=1 Tax=Ramlibacter humi TaxID=2530451 RepID=A0A4Z0BEC3_9BURK|nr:hypothetical protein [Ramlibacter humi]TFY97666.1 hypothetical protein EZ216_18240 [Ramlibacter humi]
MVRTRLLMTFVPDGAVLKAIVAGGARLDDAIALVDQVAGEAHRQSFHRVLIVVKLVSSGELCAAEYARLARHAAARLSGLRCALLAPAEHHTGAARRRQLGPDFRVFADEDMAMSWLAQPRDD